MSCSCWICKFVCVWVIVVWLIFCCVCVLLILVWLIEWLLFKCCKWVRFICVWLVLVVVLFNWVCVWVIDVWCKVGLILYRRFFCLIIWFLVNNLVVINFLVWVVIFIVWIVFICLRNCNVLFGVVEVMIVIVIVGKGVVVMMFWELIFSINIVVYMGR